MPLKKLENPPKIVLDTNNLISAQINKKGASFTIFKLFIEEKIILYSSPFQLKEMEQVLNYKRIRNKYKLIFLKIKKIIAVIKKYIVKIYPTEIPNIISNDPDDNQILAISLEEKIDFIISGDEHLLKLKKFNKIPIITAQNFLEFFLIKKEKIK